MTFANWIKTQNVLNAKNRAALNVLYGRNKNKVTNANKNAQYVQYANGRQFPAATRNKATALRAFINWYKSNAVQQMGNNNARARMFLSMKNNNRGKNYKFLNGTNLRTIEAVNNTVSPNNPNANTRQKFWAAVAKFSQTANPGGA
jgi:hypothetical protein